MEAWILSNVRENSGNFHVFYFSTDHAINSLIVVSVSARMLKLLNVSSSVTVYLSV